MPTHVACPRCGPGKAAATPAVTAGLRGLPDGLPYTVYRCGCGFEYHDRLEASRALKARRHPDGLAAAAARAKGA